MLIFLVSCKYREHKATYSIVEIDTLDGEIEIDINDFDEIDTISNIEKRFISRQ